MDAAAAPPGVRAGGQAPRPAERRAPRARDPGDGARRSPRTSTSSGSPRTTSRRRSRSSSSAAAGCWAARAGSSTASRTSTGPSWSARSCAQLYMERQDVPPRVLVPRAPGRRRRPGGVARRPAGRAGPDRRARTRARSASCMEVVTRTRRRPFHRHKLRRASDFGARSRALAELAEQLGLEQAPLRIECYDISNLGPTDTVGSMVVFEDGLPKRATTGGSRSRECPDRTISPRMEEMLRRRFTRLLKERGAPARAPRAFSYPPALVVVDGGRGQLSMATEGARRRWACTIPHDRARQAPGGGLLPRPPRPARDPARLRGAVRAAAPPRRGPPVRDHLPPRRSARSARWPRRSTTSPAWARLARRRC